MRSRVVVPALLSVVTLTAVGSLLAFSGTTLSSFADVEASTPSTVGAAVVALGRDGPKPELGYADLHPGIPQSVDLTVSYDGSVPAAVGLSFAPDGGSAFCEPSDGSWSALPGRAVTVAIGSGPAQSYCSLLDGEVLPLGNAEPDAPDLVVPVTLTLAEGAAPGSAGLENIDTATVHADGGFTDRVTGQITMSTAAADTLPPPPAGAPGFVEAALVLPGAAATVVLDVTDPAATARTASAEVGIALPAECLAAGIRPEDITEVIALDRALPVWDANVRRGNGAGPFLVLGTAVADRITGSTKDDCIVGGGGADTITGGDGDDVVVGGTGEDAIRGEAGADRLLGGAGRDDLRGGTGKDALDGGPADAACDTTPADDAVRCLAPPTSAAVPAPVADSAPAPAAPVAPEPASPSVEQARPALPERPAEEPAPAEQPAVAEPAAETIGASGAPEPSAGPAGEAADY